MDAGSQIKVVEGYIFRGSCEQRNKRYLEALQLYESGLKVVDAIKSKTPQSSELRDTICKNIETAKTLMKEARAAQLEAEKKMLEAMQSFILKLSLELSTEHETEINNLYQEEESSWISLTNKASVNKAAATVITSTRLSMESEVRTLCETLLAESQTKLTAIREAFLSASQQILLCTSEQRSRSCITFDYNNAITVIGKDELFGRRCLAGEAILKKEKRQLIAHYSKERFNLLSRILVELHKKGSDSIKLSHEYGFIDVFNEIRRLKSTAVTATQQRHLKECQEEYEQGRVSIIDLEQSSFEDINRISAQAINGAHLSSVCSEQCVQISAIQQDEQQQFNSLVDMFRSGKLDLLHISDCNHFEDDSLAAMSEIQVDEITEFENLLKHHQIGSTLASESTSRTLLLKEEELLLFSIKVMFEIERVSIIEQREFQDIINECNNRLGDRLWNERVSQAAALQKEESECWLEFPKQLSLLKAAIAHKDMLQLLEAKYHTESEVLMSSQSEAWNLLTQQHTKEVISINELLNYATELSNNLTVQHARIADEIQSEQLTSLSQLTSSHTDITKLTTKLTRRKVIKKVPTKTVGGDKMMLSRLKTGFKMTKKGKIIEELRRGSKLCDRLLTSCLVKKSELTTTHLDLVGLDEVFQQLLKKLKSDFPVIVTGPPGTGKTLLLDAVASELDQHTIFRVGSQHIITNQFGETEKRVDALFRCAASLSPSLIIIDEAEALLGTGVIVHNAVERLKAAFKRNLDTIGTNKIAVLAATSKASSMDDAIFRRLSPIRVPLPGVEEQKRYLIDICETLPGINIDLSLHDVASVLSHASGFTLSDIKKMVTDASTSSSAVVTRETLMCSLANIKSHTTSTH